MKHACGAADVGAGEEVQRNLGTQSLEKQFIVT